MREGVLVVADDLGLGVVFGDDLGAGGSLGAGGVAFTLGRGGWTALGASLGAGGVAFTLGQGGWTSLGALAVVAVLTGGACVAAVGSSFLEAISFDSTCDPSHPTSPF